MITFSHVAAAVGASVFMFGVFAACSYRPAPAPDVVTPPRAIVNTEEPAPRERHQAKFTPASPGATQSLITPRPNSIRPMMRYVGCAIQL